MAEPENTSFSTVHDLFLSKVTDDMYMELYEEETLALLDTLLISAIPWFEFPRIDLHDYDTTTRVFNAALSKEEANILAVYMIVEWVGYQLASVENIRMKYSGPDFKFTSQANHLQKLIALKEQYIKEGFHLQRLYKRRKNTDGVMTSTFGEIMGRS
jgi:hypothetical protein